MKKLLVIALIVATSVMFTGCGEEYKVEQLREEIQALEEQKENLNAEITELESYDVALKEETGTAKYVLTIEIKQVHYSLNTDNILKDSMNAITIQIPVDKEYYDSVEIGDKLSDKFRTGSYIISGSLGSWNISVKDKEIQ